jgi:hypothetical protein
MHQYDNKSQENGNKATPETSHSIKYRPTSGNDAHHNISVINPQLLQPFQEPWSFVIETSWFVWTAERKLNAVLLNSVAAP